MRMYEEMMHQNTFNPAEAHIATPKRLLEAAEGFQSTLRLKPTKVSACVGLGICLRFLGEFEGAREAFERALSLSSSNIAAHFGLANLLRVQGQNEAARVGYQRVLQLDSNHSEAEYFLSALTPGDTPASIPTSLVKDLFDAYATNFEKQLVLQLDYQGPFLLRQAVAPLLESYVSTLTVLDLGCGTGLCGEAFRDLADWLIGVELSPRAIEIARNKGVYNELVTGELIDTLLARPRSLNLILAGDVLAYMGDLEALLTACAGALCENGRFAFTTEICEEHSEFELLPQGRFAHGKQYLRAAIHDAGLYVEHYSNDILRLENQQPVHCHVIVVKHA